MSQLEFLVGAAFLLGPMVYALTLPVPEPVQCEATPAPELITVTECSELAPVVVEPAPVIVDSSPAEPREFMFVGHGNHVVLDDRVDPRWGRGELFGPEGESHHRAAKLADPTKVPAALWAEGQTLDLYDVDGKVCTARIDRLLIIAQYGWYGESLGLDEWDEDADAPTVHPPKRVYRAVWNSQPHWLIGELDQKCDGALWARDASLPPPIVLKKSDEPSATTRARLAEFERSTAVADLRKEYEEHRTGPHSYGDLEDWDTRMHEASPVVHAWIDPDGDARFVELNYGFDDQSCGSGYDTEIRSFESVRGDTFVPVPAPLTADAIFDVDLDGRFEMLDVGLDLQEYWERRLSSETKALDLSLSIAQDPVCPC